MADLTPADVYSYEARRAALRAQYADQSARNLYNQGTLGIGYQTNVRDLTRQYDQMRSRLPGGYAKRGLLNSGIYAQGLQDYGTQRANAFDALTQAYNRQRGEYGIANQGIENNLQAGLASIAAEEAARRAQLASEIRSVM